MNGPRGTAPPVEQGRLGRVVHVRLSPNQDLVRSVEQLCAVQGLAHAFVRGALGSLVDACLSRAGPQGNTGDAGDTGRDAAHEALREITGPAIEIVSVAGEVRPDARGQPRAALTGLVVDTGGQVHGGRFVAGRNLVCMTVELTLEEWLPDPG